MQNFNMQKQTLIKCSPPLSPQSITHFNTAKHSLLLLPNNKTIKMYNLNSQKFEDDLKIPNEGGPVSCITVSDDLFFFAYGMHVAASGYNGKIIFDFDTYIASDRIDRVHVVGYRLWVVCGALVNQFMLGGAQLGNKMSRKMNSPSNKVEDIRSQIIDARINSSHCIEDQFSKHYLILLKQNNTISLYQQKQLVSHKTSSPPTCLNPTSTSPSRFLVGTQSGQILCLDIDKKAIKQIWKIKQNQNGRINCIMQIKAESVFVVRDKFVELWGGEREMQGVFDVEDKYVGGLYAGDKWGVFLLSTAGNVAVFKDYMQMIKDFQKKNQQKTKQQLQKQIQSLKSQYEQLKSKLPSTKHNPKHPPTNTTSIAIQLTTTIDYQHLCNMLQIHSQCKIVKIVIKGKAKIIKASGRISYEGQDINNDAICSIQQQQKKSSTVHYCTLSSVYNSRLMVLAYVLFQGKTYAVVRNVDVKILGLYHKIGEVGVGDWNGLTIAGEFKYFQINNYMNAIFSQFGENGSNGKEWVQVYFQGVVGRDTISIRFRDGECEIRAVSPVPLISIRRYLVQMSKQKHLNFNISLNPSTASTTGYLHSLLQTLSPILHLHRQHNLLPGLYQLQNEEFITPQLKQILTKKQQIQTKYKQSLPLFNALKQTLVQLYVVNRKLKDEEVGKFETDLFWRGVQSGQIEKTINKVIN